jgi:Transcriptional Coactivator p15 (PC4)
MTAQTKLAAPVDIAEWERNRKGQVIRVGLRPYNGHVLLDVRNWWVGDDRAMHPGKGLSLPVRNLPELLAAVKKAHEKAVELGLVGGEDGE